VAAVVAIGVSAVAIAMDLAKKAAIDCHFSFLKAAS
jgi:hypothetical protein